MASFPIEKKSPEASVNPFPATTAATGPAKDVTFPDQKFDTELADVGEGLQQKRQKWYQYFSPDDTPAERRLILKLDTLIMVFVFLAYWAKVLDSSATSTAYVSGMKEDLDLYGNQLNYLNTIYMYVPRQRYVKDVN